MLVNFLSSVILIFLSSGQFGNPEVLLYFPVYLRVGPFSNVESPFEHYMRHRIA